MSFYDFLSYLTWLSPLLLISGTGIGIYYYKKLSNLYRSILYYLLVMGCIDLTSRVCGKVFKSNLYFLPILGFSEIFIFSAVFYYMGFKYSKLKYLLVFVNVTALIFSVIELFQISYFEAYHFQLYSKAANSFFIILFAIIFFFRNIKRNTIINGTIFRLNSGILIFFSLSFIIFLPLEFLVNEASVYKFYIWFANLGLAITFYIFLIGILWKNGKTHLT